MSTKTIPNPGSDEALDAGCRCAVLDNGHGRGAYGGVKGPDGKPMFWISGDCPLHADKADVDNAVAIRKKTP